MNNGNYIGFWKFFSECFVPFQGISLPLKPAHKLVCDTLEQAVLGELPDIRFVVINIAPRIGKTKILEALACWQLVYFPDSQIIYTSYSSKLCEKTTKFIQEIIRDTEWFKLLFPWVKLGNTQKSDDFNTDKGGRVYSAGTGGTITGFGAGLKRPAGGFISIDDPSNPNEALSQVEAEAIQFWFENTILRRRNSDRYCPVIIVQQRLAPNDLSGHVTENYKKETLHIVVDAEDEKGESQFPETISTATLRTLKLLNPFVYWAQYRQRPIILGGNLIKTGDFMYYDASDPIKWDKKIITCDTAMKAEQHNDFWVAQCWGKLGGTARLIDQIRGHWELPQFVDNYRAFYRKHHVEGSLVNRVTVEDKAAGTGLGQILRKEGIPIELIERNKDKVTRVQEILPYHVTHMVYLPKGVPWLPEFLNECASFRADGKAPHDDQVDSMCDGVWLTLGKPFSIFDVLGGKK